jgi:chitin synthase
MRNTKTKSKKNESLKARQGKIEKKIKAADQKTVQKRRNQMRLKGQITRVQRNRDAGQSWTQNDFSAQDGEVSEVRAKAMSDLNYTPVLSQKPINFTPDGYRLQSVENRHKIRVFTVITMYNEKASELERSLKGVFQNLDAYCKKHGADKWKEWAVCIVSDGRLKANKDTLKYAQALGTFDNNLMEEHALQRDLDVRMHLFEVSLKAFDEGFPTLQTIFALKEHNGGKLDSHLWFFNAFADQMNPKYTMLLDVGTQPEPKALYKLVMAMENNNNIAGVCGEICPGIEGSDGVVTKTLFTTNAVVAAQIFEYKTSHILDKALECALGFISVLPGAFSGYRYKAIREEEGKGPLVEYFKSITTPMSELGAFKANMYLAEDRILCFELVARKGCDWKLEYVKNAVAVTDVPDTLTTLIGQRRRWLNGSLFAMLYAVLNFGRFIEESSHSMVFKFWVTIEFAYQCVTLLLNWFLCANFFLAFYFLIKSDNLGCFGDSG